MIEYACPWDTKNVDLKIYKCLKLEDKKNGLAARLHLGWPVNVSVVDSILWEASQAPGERHLGPGDLLNVALFNKG